MSVVRSLWAAVQENPTFMRRVNGWMALFFAVLIIPSFVFHWLESVVYVSVLSLWALVSGHWAAWQAARVEEKQEEDMANRESGDPGERCPCGAAEGARGRPQDALRGTGAASGEPAG